MGITESTENTESSEKSEMAMLKAKRIASTFMDVIDIIQLSAHIYKLLKEDPEIQAMLKESTDVIEKLVLRASDTAVTADISAIKRYVEELGLTKAEALYLRCAPGPKMALRCIKSIEAPEIKLS